MKLSFLIFLFLNVTFFAQKKSDNIIVVGDSLIGRIENGYNIREVIGHVVMTQANVKITCNRAIHNITKKEATLIGNVVATQDTITVVTERGYYYGNGKYIYSDTFLTLEDGHIVLTADTGKYYFELKKSIFNSNVQLVDSTNILNSDRLLYFNDLGKAVAVGNVSISDDKSIIYCDSLEHFRENSISYAFDNVEINNFEQNLKIFGNKLFNNGEENYSKVTGNTLLEKIDSSDNGKKDTLLISAEIFESKKDSVTKFIATDSVKIIRGNLRSRNNYSILYKERNELVTFRRKNDRESPVLWYENSQVIGDTINIFIGNEKLDSIHIRKNAIIISQNDKNRMKFDQISGDRILLKFKNNSLAETDVSGNVLSIYYLYEDEKPNGLMKSSSGRAIMLFEKNGLTKVKMFNSVESEFHPENLVKGKEVDFTLPDFIIIKDKPLKNELTLRSKNHE